MGRSSLGLASLAFLILLVGCSRKVDAPAAGGNGEPEKQKPSANDLKALEEGLADLDRQIAARARELADLKLRAEALREKIATVKGVDPRAATPIAELLAELPKDLLPKDSQDSLKWAQAEEWYKKNVVGKRASWTMGSRKEIRFEPNGKGQFNAHLSIYGTHIKFGGSEIPWRMGGITSNHHTLSVYGLTAEAAEKLRSIPNEKGLDVTFTVESIMRPQPLYGNILYITSTRVAINGIGP